MGVTKLADPLTKAEIFARSLKIVVGKPLPDLPVKRLNGTAARLASQFKPGRSTLINIWATWCIPCAKEMPELERLRPQLAARKIDIVGLNVDTDPNVNIGKYLAAKRITYPIVVGSVGAIERIYATDELTVPLSILVDERGIVKDVIPGWSAETQKKFKSLSGETAEPQKSTATGRSN